jgi:cobalt-zinc-cadmium efflux system protein
VGNGHAHHHRPTSAHRSRLVVVIAMTTAVLIAQVVGAWWTGSLALLADAGHMFTDVAGLSLALVAMVLADTLSTARSTYGFYRLEIFAAVVNAVILLGVAAGVIWSALRRVDDPPAIDSGPMLWIALIGAAVNLVALRLLQPGAAHSLNLRGAYLEVLGDLLGSVAVVVAAVVIIATGEYVADPVASLLIAALIVPRTWLLLREAVDILLEATPRGVDLHHIREHICGVEGVVGVHDLHVWTITSGMPVMSAHVVVDEETLAGSGPGPVLARLSDCLDAHFDVAHCTFQIEPVGHQEQESQVHP